MKVLVHGARGSYPTSQESTLKYGGQTPCVEVVHAEERIILDAGTGILQVDADRISAGKRIHILLTHLHMDHILGLGFFRPLFNAENEVHIWGPYSRDAPLRERINRYLSPPFFPLPLRDISCKMVLHELKQGTFAIGNFTIYCEYVVHPGPTLGFRVTAGEKVFTYLPDHEPMLGQKRIPDNRWLSGYNLILGADLLIHDAQYTVQEYEQRIGWGHSSFQQACAVAQIGSVKKMLFFHHDPEHGDDFLDTQAEKMTASAAISLDIARGGMIYPV